MGPFVRRLLSRLYAERDRLARRVLGAAGAELVWVSLDVGALGGATGVQRAARPSFVDPAELRRAPERLWLEREGVERMLAGGDRVLAIRLGEEPIYRAVVTSDPPRTGEVLAQRGIAGRGWLVSGVVTHPAHRGMGLHGEAMAWLAREARRADVQRLVAWVARWNRSSLRAFERAGFRPLPPAPSSPGVERHRAME